MINLFIQYTPYKPSDGSWEDPAYRVSEILEIKYLAYVSSISLIFNVLR